MLVRAQGLDNLDDAAQRGADLADAVGVDDAVLDAEVEFASMVIVPLSLFCEVGPWGYLVLACTGHGPGFGMVGGFPPKAGAR